MVKACKIKMSGVKMSKMKTSEIKTDETKMGEIKTSEVKVRYGKNKKTGYGPKRLYPDIFAVLTFGPFMTQAVLREIRPPSV